jgi:hypothetical protein
MLKILAIVLALNSYGTPPGELEVFAIAIEKVGPVERAFLLGLAWSETDFRTHCVSHAGAASIMQLMPSTEYTREQIEDDPGIAVHFARIELAKWLSKCGKKWQIAAWNRGHPRCCSGWYIKKRKHTKPEGYFECEERHRGFQRKVEGRARRIGKWLDRELKIVDCTDSTGKSWPVALLPGRVAKSLENAGRAGLVCQEK